MESKQNQVDLASKMIKGNKCSHKWKQKPGFLWTGESEWNTSKISYQIQADSDEVRLSKINLIEINSSFLEQYTGIWI